MAARGLLGTLRDFFVGVARAPESYPDVTKLLESRIAALELDNSERQVAVLSAVEKTLHQLRARDAQRRKGGDEGDHRSPEDAAPPDQDLAPVASTAHLSRRFRRI